MIDNPGKMSFNPSRCIWASSTCDAFCASSQSALISSTLKTDDSDSFPHHYFTTFSNWSIGFLADLECLWISEKLSQWFCWVIHPLHSIRSSSSSSQSRSLLAPRKIIFIVSYTFHSVVFVHIYRVQHSALCMRKWEKSIVFNFFKKKQQCLSLAFINHSKSSLARRVSCFLPKKIGECEPLVELRKYLSKSIF